MVNIYVSLFLKIILAFGNYMNGARKKVAAGFKLESLYKVRSSRSIAHA
jgi:hypothetical protein